MKNIEFHQAVALHKVISEKRQQEIDETIKEIKNSCFDMYNAADINALAEKAGITPNECRYMNMEHQGLSTLDLLHTFEGDDTDSVIDFY